MVPDKWFRCSVQSVGFRYVRINTKVDLCLPRKEQRFRMWGSGVGFSV